MYPFKKRFASAALLLSLTAAGAVFAQDDNEKSDVDGAVPPAAGVPQAGDVIPRDGSSRDWRGEIEADREQKGWDRSRPRSQSNSRQNWSRQYQDRLYSGGEDRWDRFRDPQDRSDGADQQNRSQERNSFSPVRPNPRANAGTQVDAETRAQTAAIYWMMKAQAAREEAQADEDQARQNPR